MPKLPSSQGLTYRVSATPPPDDDKHWRPNPHISSFNRLVHYSSRKRQEQAGGSIPKHQLYILLFCLAPLLIFVYGFMFAEAFMYVTENNEAATQLRKSGGGVRPAMSSSLRAVERAAAVVEGQNPQDLVAEMRADLKEEEEKRKRTKEDAAAKMNANKMTGMDDEERAKKAAEEMLAEHAKSLNEREKKVENTEEIVASWMAQPVKTEDHSKTTWSLGSYLSNQEVVGVPETPIEPPLSQNSHITKDSLALVAERKNNFPETLDTSAHLTNDYISLRQKREEIQHQDYIALEDIVLPNVLLVGPLKTGTTSIAEWLFTNGVCHPEVMAGEPSYYEQGVQFFDQQSRYEQGLQFYAKRWQRCKDSAFSMDATPTTLSFPSQVESIYKEVGGNHLKQLKVIVMLREPIAREMSFYTHKVHEYKRTKDRNQWYGDVSEADGSIMPFNKHANTIMSGIQHPDMWGMGDAGLYVKHLSGWLKFLDRRQILAISFDEFEKNNLMVEHRISDFLGFEFPGAIPVTTSHKVQVHKRKPSCSTQQRLNAIFEPMNQELYKMLNVYPGPLMEQRPFPAFRQMECDAREVYSELGEQTAATPIIPAKPSTPGLVAHKSHTFVLPNILLIGAQKAGTTAIGEWLFQTVCRPQVFDGEPYYYDKEVQFFDRPERYEEGLFFYSRRYEHCRDMQFSMDATPNTLSMASHVENTYFQAGGDYLKTLKVIVVLREPISRELSLYNHRLYEYQQTMDMNQWYSNIAKSDGSVVPFHDYTDILINDIVHPLEFGKEWGIADQGQYVIHLKKWMKFIDRKNLLVISYDELKENPAKVEERISYFFGYDFRGHIGVINTNEHDAKMDRPECKTLTKLRPYYASMNEELYKLLEENPGPPSEQRPFPRFRDPECTM